MSDITKGGTLVALKAAIFKSLSTIYDNGWQHQVGEIGVEGDAIMTAIQEHVAAVIGDDYQLPSKGPVWDGLRRANEEHQVQRERAGLPEQDKR